MKLDWIEYHEYEGRDNSWSLLDVKLKDINLFVGRNASGKTRSAHAIVGLAKVLSDTGPLKFNCGHYNAIFSDSISVYEYELVFEEKKVTKEELKVDGEIKLIRSLGGEGKIYYEENNKQMSFKIPDNQIAVSSKRDDVQHPFLEGICEWAKHSAIYHFGSDMGRNSFSVSNLSTADKLDFRDEIRVVDYFLRGVDVSKSFERDIINDMEIVGYFIESIVVESSAVPELPKGFSIPAGSTSPKGILVKEKDIKVYVPQHALSQGMFRALSIVIHVNYVLCEHTPSMIIIDDIGEGLDHKRSKSLIKLLVDKFKDSGCQIIMTTNDQFVMDAIGLEYWNVIARSGAVCKVMNEENTPDAFKDFRFMGLSNFEFLAMDFYLGEDD